MTMRLCSSTIVVRSIVFVLALTAPGLTPTAFGQANSPGTLTWNNGTSGTWQHNWGGANNRFAGVSGIGTLSNPKDGFDSDVARFGTVVTSAKIPLTSSGGL